MKQKNQYFYRDSLAGENNLRVLTFPFEFNGVSSLKRRPHSTQLR